MKKIFLTFLALAIALSALSCANDGSTASSEEIPSQDEYSRSPKDTSASFGSASELSGRCLLIDVFISRDNAEWTAEKIERTLETEKAAVSFLERTASLYNTELVIVPSGSDGAETLYCGIADALLRSAEWTNSVFENTSCGSLAEYVSAKHDVSGYDSYFVVFHVIADERSFAVCCDKAYSDWEDYVTERCVVFHTENEDYEYADTPYTYAHEILHLFGAKDLYVPNVAEEKEQKFRNLFPNDVMNHGNDDLELLSVSPYTAWRVGWTNVLDEKYDFLTD